MNIRNDWEATLKMANEDLKEHGMEIIVRGDGPGMEVDSDYYTVFIKEGDEEDVFADNYFAEELGEVVNDAWAHARTKARRKARGEKTTVYVLTSVGLSDSNYDANGRCDTYVFYSQVMAEAKLKALRDAEIEDSNATERECEILEDEPMEFRISWCGGGEQLRLQIQETYIDE